MKSILIISSTFYPDPSVASIRVSEFAKYMSRSGIKVYVVCKQYGYGNGAQDSYDWSGNPILVRRLGYFNKSLVTSTHSKSKSNKYSSIKKLFSNLKSSILNHGVSTLFVPSHSVIFWRGKIQEIEKIITDNSIDVIFSSSPHHAVHWVGRCIKRKYSDIAWIADFRDPYIIDSRFAPSGISKCFFKFHQQFEKNIYHEADLITHAIPLHARWSALNYKNDANKIKLLLNGIPSELIAMLNEAQHQSHLKSDIVISVVGSISALDSANLAKAIKTLHANAKLKIVGPVPDSKPELQNTLDDRLVLKGRVIHQQALQEIVESDILVSFLSAERAQTKCLTSKMFEYLATGKPVISVNPTRPDKLFFSRYPWVTFLTKPSVQILSDVIKSEVERIGTENHDDLLRQIRLEYSREGQAKQLVSWVKELHNKKHTNDGKLNANEL